jgi:hypothetical protein
MNYEKGDKNDMIGKYSEDLDSLLEIVNEDVESENSESISENVTPLIRQKLI